MRVFIQAFGFVNLFIDSDYACEVDYKIEKDDFIDNLNQTITFMRHPHLNIPHLDEQDDIETWIAHINKQWVKQGYNLYQIDIDSDSYVLFISHIKDEKLAQYNEVFPLTLFDTATSIKTETTDNEMLETLFGIVFEQYKKKNVKEFIDITFTLDSPTIFQSKLGGLPYLGKEDKTPLTKEGNPMRLFIQINFEELPQHKLPYPSKGLLQIWLKPDDLYGMDFEDGMVIKYHESLDQSVTEQSINEKYVQQNVEDNYFVFENEYGLTFKNEQEVMSRYDSTFDDTFSNLWNALLKEHPLESIGDIEHLFEKDGFDDYTNGSHKLGGFPFFTQWDPRDDDRLTYEFLLLQVDSDFTDGYDIMWGDSGIGNFFISEKDLKELDFTDVLFNWDCY